MVCILIIFTSGTVFPISSPDLRLTAPSSAWRHCCTRSHRAQFSYFNIRSIHRGDANTVSSEDWGLTRHHILWMQFQTLTRCMQGVLSFSATLCNRRCIIANFPLSVAQPGVGRICVSAAPVQQKYRRVAQIHPRGNKQVHWMLVISRDNIYTRQR